jgi:DNA-binding transcriptional LysR family regulator
MSERLPELEPKLLRSFVVVAEELHFGRAARRLHLSQPPLSMQIKKLEQELGARLFERDRRHVALTEAGSFLLERARHLLGESARAWEETRRIARGESGALAVGYTPTATYEILPPAIRAFRAARPEVRLELVEMRSPDQAEALRSARIEVGLACGPLWQRDLQEHVLVEEPVMLAVSSTHALARAKRVTVSDLAVVPFVSVRPDIEPAWADACWDALRRAGVAVRVAQETDSKIAMLGLVAANLGVSLVSASVRRLAREGVVLVPLHGFDLRLPLISLAQPNPSPRAREFLRLLRPAASSARRRRKT